MLYIYIDLLKLDSRTKLQPQRRIPKAPTRHINEFQRMILAQKLLITQYVDLGIRIGKYIIYRVHIVYIECIYSVIYLESLYSVYSI